MYCIYGLLGVFKTFSNGRRWFVRNSEFFYVLFFGVQSFDAQSFDVQSSDVQKSFDVESFDVKSFDIELFDVQLFDVQSFDVMWMIFFGVKLQDDASTDLGYTYLKYHIL